jgi:sugar phosphate isomerase/epimerase
MLQMEIPQWVNARVAKAAKARGIPVFQDIGGAEKSLEELGEGYLALCDYVSPNETELKRLTKMAVDTKEEVIAAAKYLQTKGASNVLVTLGHKGAILVTAAGEVITQECWPVEEVKDETGAGDNFRGAFVVSHYVDGKTLRQSLDYAAASAALSVGKLGGIPSCTTREECEHAVALRYRGGSTDDSDECPLLFASRLNSMKDREAVLSEPSTCVEGWVLQQGLIAGLGLVDFNYPQHFQGPVSEKERATLLATLDEAGLKCGAVCLRFPRHMQAGAMTHPDPAVREEAVQLVEEACEWSQALGSSEVVVWSAFCGYDYSLQADYKVLWDRVKSAFQRVCSRYPTIKLSLEFKPSDENTRFFAVPSTAAAILLVREVGRANFGLTLDLGHTLMAGENPAQSVAMVHALAGEDKLFGVQLGDGPTRSGEDGLAFGSVHESAAFEFVYWLRKTAFHRHGGHIYFDTFPRNEDARRECEYNIRQFKRLWARAGRWLRDPKLDEIRKKQDAMGLLEYQEDEMIHKD